MLFLVECFRVLIKNEMAPDDPMMGLFESSAVNPRKLATIAAEISGFGKS